VTLPRTSYPRFGPLGLAAPFQGADSETAARSNAASHSASRNRPFQGLGTGLATSALAAFPAMHPCIALLPAPSDEAKGDGKQG